jgi:hypothetical protein
VKVHVEPVHPGLDPEVSAIDTVGAAPPFTLIVIPFDATVATAAQGAFDVNWQETTSPLFKDAVVNDADVAPETLLPLMRH